jgi:hypothetical protein
MPTDSLIADLFAAVERAEGRLKARAVESVERSTEFPQPKTETAFDRDALARTRANIDRYWRNHFGENQYDKSQYDKSRCDKDQFSRIGSAGVSSETISSESE